MENSQIIWNYFKAKGWTEFGIAGLMGNVQTESGFIPTNLQNTYEKKLGFTDLSYTAAVDSGAYKNFATDKAGYGLCQWTSSGRKQALYNFAKKQKKSIGNLEMQLDYLYSELTTSYKSVLKIMKSAESVKEASDCFMCKFERPANQTEANKAKRAQKGQVWYNTYHKAESNEYTSEQFVKDCQTILKVTATGVADAKLLKLTVTLSKSKNNKHALVLPLQKYLNSLGYSCGTPDRSFGSKTEAAVKQYQKDHCCVPDGEITAKNRTWKTLLGLI